MIESEEYKMKDIKDMNHKEFSTTYKKTLRRYPDMECTFNTDIKYEFTQVQYEKIDGSNRWIEVDRKNKVITGQHYMNIIDAIDFFRNLGGRETVSMGYTSVGYIPVKLKSINPDITVKIVRTFNPVDK